MKYLILWNFLSATSSASLDCGLPPIISLYFTIARPVIDFNSTLVEGVNFGPKGTLSLPSTSAFPLVQNISFLGKGVGDSRITVACSRRYKIQHPCSKQQQKGLIQSYHAGLRTKVL